MAGGVLAAAGRAYLGALPRRRPGDDGGVERRVVIDAVDVALALQLLAWAGVATIFAARRDASLFHPLAFYLVFHLLVFVIRPILVHAAGFDTQWRYMHFTPSPDTFVATLAVSSFGLLVFAAASLTRAAPAEQLRHSGLRLTRTHRLAYWIVVAVLLPPGLYGAWLDAGIFGTFARHPGEVGMIRDEASAHTYFTGTTGYVVKAHHMLIPLAALFIAMNRFRAWAYCPLLAVCAYRLYIGSRWGLVIAVGMVLLLHLYRRGARWPRLRHLGAALLVFLAFHAVGQNRDVFRELTGLGDTRPGIHEPTQASFVETLDSADFANFDFLAYIVDVVPARAGTYTYFSQHLALVTQPVPRVLWSDKPRGSPVQLVDLNAHGWFGTRTTSLVGDGWMSLGLPGVALTMAFAGWLLGRTHRWFQRSRDRPARVFLYCCLMPVSLLWFRDGALVSFAQFAMWMALPVALWWLTVRVLTRADRPRGGDACKDRA